MTDQVISSLLKYKKNESFIHEYDVFLHFTFDKKLVKIKSNLTNIVIGQKLIIEKINNDYVIKELL